MYEIVESLFKNVKIAEISVSQPNNFASLCWDPLKLGTSIAAE